MAASAIAVDPHPSVVRVPSPLAMWAIGFGGCASAATALALGLTNPAIGSELGEPLAIALLNDWIILSYTLGGLVAWWRRPASRLGPLMIGAGFVMFLSTLNWSESPAPYTIGQALDLVPPALFLHVFLAFPDGRLHGRLEVTLVAAAYATAVGLELVRMLLGEFGSSNLLAVTSNPDAAETLRTVQFVAFSTLSVSAVGVLAAGRRRSGPPLRRSIALLVGAFSLSLLLLAAFFISAVFRAPWLQQLRWATFAALGLAPTAFVLALFRARLAQSAVGDLFVELRTHPAPADLRDALARAVRDPSLRLAYWLPQYHSWADLEGRPVELPEKGGGSAMTIIDQEGAPVAALLHDPALSDEPELLESVRAAAGIALENAQLQAELRARLEEVRGSRLRIVAATQAERQRLERNLHDGAQQRLIALSLELGRLADAAGADVETQVRLEEAQREIRVSLEELRDVARGLHPAVVSGHGLAVALEQLAARAPVPAQLTVAVDGRLPEQLEIAAYYLVSESLANIGKHAQATAATIEVRRTGRELVVEIVDDGIGGAATERGSGLRGLADRVEALDGTLRVWSPAGGGTRMRAEMPCEP